MNTDWRTDTTNVSPLLVGQVKNNVQVLEGSNQEKSHPPCVHFQDNQKTEGTVVILVYF